MTASEVEAQEEPSQAPVGTSRTRHRTLRRRRRLLGFVALLSPCLWMLATDLFRRSDHISRLDRWHKYGSLAGVAGGLLFVSVLCSVASRRRGTLLRDVVGVLFVVLYTLALGVEGAFHRTWNTYLSHDAQVHSKSILRSLVGTLPLARPYIWAEIALAFVVSIGLLLFARKFVRPRKIPRMLVPVLVVPALAVVVSGPGSYPVLPSPPPGLSRQQAPPPPAPSADGPGPPLAALHESDMEAFPHRCAQDDADVGTSRRNRTAAGTDVEHGLKVIDSNWVVVW